MVNFQVSETKYFKSIEYILLILFSMLDILLKYFDFTKCIYVCGFCMYNYFDLHQILRIG